tara:strand:- start:110 stop:910 length:801 start_codon:yes stop_codon:yes gene_type:complete
MSKQAMEYKSLHKDVNFKELSLAELNKLPSHNGVYDFKISKTSFLMLNIINDDSSIVKHFWRDSHDLEELDLWFEISKDEGVFIDVGAHTGLYTIASLKANRKNTVVCFEPYFMNLSRLITNLRLNSLFNNVSTILGAVSNFDGKSKFKITTEKSYMSKGGKLSEEGQDTDVYKLDTLFYKKFKKKLNAIKIDTEGEDFNVLLGAEKLIKEHKPKILIEVREKNKLDIVNFLKSNSYKIYNIRDLDNEFNFEKNKIENIINLYATL